MLPRLKDYDLQQKLKPMMVDKKPLPSIYFPDFIAANQSERADNVLTGSKQEQMDQVCACCRRFCCCDCDDGWLLWLLSSVLLFLLLFLVRL